MKFATTTLTVATPIKELATSTVAATAAAATGDAAGKEEMTEGATAVTAHTKANDDHQLASLEVWGEAGEAAIGQASDCPVKENTTERGGAGANLNLGGVRDRGIRLDGSLLSRVTETGQDVART
ncbi:hypothetical protein Gpo141_00013653 [Globisporangium polare]